MPSTSRKSSGPSLPAVALGLALGAWLLAAGAGVRAAPQPPDPKLGSFSESTEVTVVQVPVQVVRDGGPVQGLTAADFAVFDGRKPQKVTGFEVLDLSARQGPAVASIPPALRRHFLMLFDLAFSEPKSVIKARQMVREMLPALHPSDLVAVATYSNSRGPRIAVGFTSDRRQVLQAIDTLGLPELVDRNPDPLSLIAADLQQQRASGGAARQEAQAAALENAKDFTKLSERANREQQQAIAAALARSFSDLARLLDSVHGRKQVIYLSEGFDTALLLGTEDQKAQADMADLSIHGQGYLIDSDKRYGDTRGANVLEKMMEQFRRSDCIIQAVDIGGLRAQGDLGPARASGEGTLFAMAHDTGGELYRNFNDLAAAMNQVLKKTSITYVLSFQPDEIKHDGSYHKLRVELKNGPATKGAQIFFRPGYYAPKPYRQQTATERTLAAAENVIGGGDSGAVGMAVLAAPFRVAGDKAYVPVVIEADGASLLAGTGGNALPAEIYAYAISSSGTIQDFFTQSLRFDLAKVAPALRQGGIKFYGHLDLPPGEYNVRVLVRNGGTGAFGLRSQPLVVPAFSEAAAVLLPPFFPETPGRWLMVRESGRGEQQSAPYPFVVQEKAYIPSSRPVLAAGQDAAVALVGYHLPAGGLKAEARVLAADGKDLGEGDLKLGGRENPDAAGEDRLTATFRPPASLVPGEYQLVIVLTDAQGVAHNSATRFVVPAPAQGAHG
ncbi:MAG TPA: VWA domain-containing protein [Thermoanaerobaculia bacterium]|nr:VWA domain-containing protein [Thermoanaerobaculia bacterium]